MKLSEDVLRGMSNRDFVRMMKLQGACPEAVKWAEEHEGTPIELWKDCTRGDWLGWFVRQNLEALGYRLQDWASALSYSLETDDFTDTALADALRGYAQGSTSLERAVVLGWPYGLTSDLNIPMGRWLFLSETADVFKKHFPIFEGKKGKQL